MSKTGPPKPPKAPEARSVPSGHNPACAWPDDCACNDAYAGSLTVRGVHDPCTLPGHVGCEVYLTLSPVVTIRHHSQHVIIRPKGAGVEGGGAE